jgi:DNA polymerase elongation subunit (family B)
MTSRDSQVKPDAQDIFGKPLVKISSNENPYELKALIEQYDSSNFPVYGYSKVANSYIYENFKNQKVDYSLVHTHYVDIETTVEHGKIDPIGAREEINIITTFSTRSKSYTCFYVHNKPVHKFDEQEDEVGYVKCKDEKELLTKYIRFHSSDYPDIMTGWNFKFFDIVYIHQRAFKLLDEDLFKKLSPYGIIQTRDGEDDYGNPALEILLKGITILDYKEVYKKFIKKPREQYTLDYIAKVELKSEKLKHHSGIPGHLLYRKYFSDALLYNIQDVRLLVQLEAKLKLIYLTQVISYISYTNFEDILTNMRIIDMMFYTFLKERGKYFEWKYEAPPMAQFEGAAVKETIPGKYRWVVSFDVTSEYPSLIRAMNISPETKVKKKFPISPASIIGKTFVNDEILENDWTVAGNGQVFIRNKDGFMPDVIRYLFKERAKYKALKVQADKDHNKELSEEYDTYQNAMKVLLNSIYGVTGARFFRFYDIDIAEAITLGGQSMIGWVIRDVNASLQKLMGDKKDRIIASDTDSIYVDLGDIVEKKFGKIYDNEKALEFVTKFSDENINKLIAKSIANFAEYLNCIDRGALDMKREAVSDSAIFVAKKRYIMSIRNKEGALYDRGEEIKITGMEAIKSSTPEVLRNEMTEVFKTLLFEGRDGYYSKINSFESLFYKFSPNEIATNSSVNGISQYLDGNGRPIKGTPFNSKGAIAYNKMIKDLKLTEKYSDIVEGDKIKLMKLKTPNIAMSNCIGWKNEIPLELEEILRKDMNYDLIWADSFKNPMDKVAAICGIKPESNVEENPWL